MSRHESGNAWQDRSVLVTGGTGFIGRHLCRKLVDLGARVSVLSRRSMDDLESSWGLESVDLRRCDPADPRALASVFDAVRPKTVFHLAGLVRGTRERDAVLPMLDANLRVAVLLMDAAVDAGCSRFVQAGSLEEPDDLESAPASPYAASKLAASAYARLYAHHYGLSTAVARIFMVYGPGPQDENKLVPYVIRRLLAGDPPELSAGTRPVDWVYVEDVAEGLIALAHSDAERAELGSGELHTVREVAELIEERVGGAEMRFGAREDRAHERVLRADLEVNRGVDWAPRTSLDEGLERTVAWFRD